MKEQRNCAGSSISKYRARKAGVMFICKGFGMGKMMSLFHELIFNLLGVSSFSSATDTSSLEQQMPSPFGRPGTSDICALACFSPVSPSRGSSRLHEHPLVTVALCTAADVARGSTAAAEAVPPQRCRCGAAAMVIHDEEGAAAGVWYPKRRGSRR